MKAADPLRMLVEVSQNFPSLAGALSRITIPEDVRAEIRAATQPLSGMGQACAYVHGLSFALSSSHNRVLLQRS